MNIFKLSFFLLTTLTIQFANADGAKIDDLFSQNEKTAIELVFKSGLSLYYCDVTYEEVYKEKAYRVAAMPKFVYARTDKEAYQICLNVSGLVILSDKNGAFLALIETNPKTRTQTVKRVIGVAVRGPYSHNSLSEISNKY